MDLFSIKFFIFFVCSIVVYYFSPATWRNRVVLPVLNVTFILLYVQTVGEIIPFAGFLTLGFLGIRLVRLFPGRGTFIASLAVILVSFIYLKKYEFFSFLSFIERPYLAVGLSYVLFRIVQMLIDVHQKEIIEKIPLISFVNFCCNFFTFVSGPIQRYQDYKQQENAVGDKALSEDEVLACFSRMITGFFKVIVISALCLVYHRYELEGLKEGLLLGHSLFSGKFILTAFFYTLYMFFNFSGYMDIVIGLGRLFGFQLPENFNRPFSSRSFLEFWSRWHITLSEWFKFYLFNPVLKLITYKWQDQRMVPYLGVVAFFITFLVMGIWHGSSMAFVIYGLFLGLGAAVNKLFDVLMRKYCSKVYKKCIAHEVSGICGSALTFTYFSMALTCFWFDLGNLTALMGKWRIMGFLINFSGGVLISGMFIFGIHAAKGAWDRITAGGAVLAGNFYFIRAWLALLLFISIAFWSYADGSMPEFVYKAF